MIVYKQWKETKHKNYSDVTIYYDGWYLFGVIPLYIRIVK